MSLQTSLQPAQPLTGSPVVRAEQQQTLDGIQNWVIDESIIQRLSSLYWDWRRLVETIPGSTAVEHPDFVLNDVGRGTERLPTQLITLARSGKLIGVCVLAPRSISARKYTRMTPDLTLNVYRIAGGRLTGELDAEDHAALLRAASDLTARSTADALLVEDLNIDSRLWKQLEEQQPLWCPASVQTRHEIRFPEDPAAYWEKFSGKTRKKFRKRVRSFGEHRLQRITDIEDVPQFLEDASRISANSWQAQQIGQRIQNDERELRMLTSLAGIDALRSYVLYRGDEPVAFELAYQYHGLYLAEDASYDARFASDSPGQVLQLLVLEDLSAHDSPAVYDFGCGDAEYKRIFGTDCAESANVMIIQSRLAARCKTWMVRAGLSCERLTRLALRQLGVFKRLRQRSRSAG